MVQIQDAERDQARAPTAAALEALAAALQDLLRAERGLAEVRMADDLVRVRRALIQVGTSLALTNDLPPTACQQCRQVISPLLQAAYTTAVGRPVTTDEELWQWLREQAAIAAEAERQVEERAWQRGVRVLQRALQTSNHPPAYTC